MKILNWAKEKIKALSDWHGRKLHGDIPRFNKTAPLVRASTRDERKEERWRIKFHRWASMPALHGGPVLTGERLRKNLSMCSPLRLIVQPRYRKETL